MKYKEIDRMTAVEIESAISHDQPNELSIAALSAALYSDDAEWAENVCARLARHRNETVRGNAVLGFGHLARISGKLTESRTRQLIEAALKDESDYVRGHAESAADDVEQFLGWRLDRKR
jgi:hypothetical protein